MTSHCHRALQSCRGVWFCACNCDSCIDFRYEADRQARLRRCDDARAWNERLLIERAVAKARGAGSWYLWCRTVDREMAQC